MNARMIGTKAYGIRAPIIKSGDDISEIVVNAALKAVKADNIALNDRDVIGVTEAVVAKAQGNYATVRQIAGDVRQKTGGKKVGLVFPIFSRNRFSILLKAIAGGCDELFVQLSYPSDEVGNSLVPLDLIEEKGVNPFSDSFDEQAFRKIFGDRTIHTFTGVDYIDFYKSMDDNITVLLSNNPKNILKYTDCVIACDVHTRGRTKRRLEEAGAKTVLGLDDILAEPFDGSGYNEHYGLLGSNKATEESVKLFPRDCDQYVLKIQKTLKEKTGKNIEVMIYGDGAFKDPACGIWELAVPVVSPAHTAGLSGTPNEIKLKFIADNEFASLRGKELEEAVKNSIRKKDGDLYGKMASEGTTPRHLTDLLGSLCDLVSGSGDKGTPIVLIQGYFDNYDV